MFRGDAELGVDGLTDPFEGVGADRAGVQGDQGRPPPTVVENDRARVDRIVHAEVLVGQLLRRRGDLDFRRPCRQRAEVGVAVWIDGEG